MSTYCQISADEMRGMLKIEKGWREAVCGREIVFSYNLKCRREIEIKVFSSIKMDSGMGRDCGKDAIRIAAVNIARNVGWIKTCRVNRTTNWRDNLKARILEVIEKSKERFN